MTTIVGNPRSVSLLREARPTVRIPTMAFQMINIKLDIVTNVYQLYLYCYQFILTNYLKSDRADG